METVTGNLSELGNSLQKNHGTQYSFVSVGDTMLQLVVVPRGLDNFVHRALNTVGDTTVYVVKIGGKNFIAGVRTPDGKLFYHYQDSALGYLMVLFGLPLLVVLIGIAFISQGLAILSLANASEQLQRMGGTAIR